MAMFSFKNLRVRYRGLSLLNLAGVSISLIAIATLLAIAQRPANAQQDAFRRAVELSQAGKPHDAELAWRQLALSHPQNTEVHLGLGAALAQQDNLAGAAREYRKALALNPNLRGVSFNLGLAEFKQGHFAAAIKPLTAAAKENPQDKRSSLLIGMSYFGLHDYGKAVPFL
ncbi:MAG: tetratricopeptide repeat protein, partial [Edaphobacter sp.]